MRSTKLRIGQGAALNLNVQNTSTSKYISYSIVFIMCFYSIATLNLELESPSPFKSFLVSVIAPVQEKATNMKVGFSSFLDHYFFIVNTSKENVQLKKKLSELGNRIFMLSEIQKENDRLKQLLEFGKYIEKRKILAQVISWDSENEFKIVRINKGESNGIQLRSPVITMDGLVGYVVSLTDDYADVMTILDQNNRVDAIISSTRSHGIVEGLSKNRCHIKYVSRAEPIVEGDTVITAGLGDIYPKGIKIGSISKIEKESYGITQYVELSPSVDFQRLEEVVVLLD